jgi:hypothetical protein
MQAAVFSTLPSANEIILRRMQPSMQPIVEIVDRRPKDVSPYMKCILYGFTLRGFAVDVDHPSFAPFCHCRIRVHSLVMFISRMTLSIAHLDTETPQATSFPSILK